MAANSPTPASSLGTEDLLIHVVGTNSKSLSAVRIMYPKLVTSMFFWTNGENYPRFITKCSPLTCRLLRSVFLFHKSETLSRSNAKMQDILERIFIYHTAQDKSILQPETIYIFLISPRKHILWVLIRSASRGTSNEYPQHILMET